MKKDYTQATIDIIYCSEQEDIITTSGGGFQERTNEDVFDDRWWEQGV